MTVWKGTWKPDGTGGWHTKSDKDIVEQYNSARLTPAPAQMLKDAIDEIERLRKYEKLVHYIASDYWELSNDKIRWLYTEYKEKSRKLIQEDGLTDE